MVGFEEGYKFFVDNSSAIVGAEMSGSYVGTVDEEIKKLINDLNSLEGFKTSSKMLKGDVAEFWHAGTFNIKALIVGAVSLAILIIWPKFKSLDKIPPSLIAVIVSVLMVKFIGPLKDVNTIGSLYTIKKGLPGVSVHFPTIY